MPSLIDPLTFRALTLRNRIGISPMCMYSADEGVPNDWHLMHLGARAAGGAGLIFTEASAVEPRGRISPTDAGLWNDEQADAWQRIVRFVKSQGAAIGVQLAHAGRKASTSPPWENRGKPLADARRWQPIGPSELPFNDDYPTPHAMTLAEIATVTRRFAEAATRAVDVGFDTIEIHAAHGYLLHNFYSPASNRRTDAYGGSFENRTRLLREVAIAIRGVIPDAMPLFCRLSCTDWTDGAWTITDSVELAKALKPLGVDAIDCSSGGNVTGAKIPGTEPGYQVPFAEQIKRDAAMPTAAVGMITTPQQADAIMREGRADLVLIARESLRDPNFPQRAMRELKGAQKPPVQYERAWM